MKFNKNATEGDLGLFKLDLELYNEINEVKPLDLNQITGVKEQTMHYVFDIQNGFTGIIMA